jgi:hypothetical protein
MDDVELAQLELRLRKSVVGHAPAAPDALVRFIDTVPAMEPAGRRLGFAGTRPGVRRAFFALAAAAVIVVAVAGTAALVAIRGDQTRGAPAASDGWSWQQADGTAVRTVLQVSRGFVGTCTDDKGTDSLCTSRDGSSWTVPVDPTIVTVEGSAQFWPTRIVKSAGVYVAVGPKLICETTARCPDHTPYLVPSIPSEQLWRSTDGVRWSRVDSPAFTGLDGLTLGVVAGSFVVLAREPGGTAAGWALTSADGLTWSRASQVPVSPIPALVGDPPGQQPLWAPGTWGISVADVSSPDPVEWRSLDGRTWTRLHLPSGIEFAYGGRIADGSYMGFGIGSSTAANAALGVRIVRSADGLTWRVDQGNLDGFAIGIVSVGDRLIASVFQSQLSPDSATTGMSPIWESADLGHTWQPLLDTTGHQLIGTVSLVGDRLAIYTGPHGPTSLGRLEWLGSRNPAFPVATSTASTAGSVAATASATPTATATATPGLSDGWSWRHADGTMVRHAFAVANGYLGECGGSAAGDLAPCTSPDGVRWTTPPDPAIETVTGDAGFLPSAVVRSGDVYLAEGENYSGYSLFFGASPPAVPSGVGFTLTQSIWRSTDGVNWSRVDAFNNGELTAGSLINLSGGGFVVVADAGGASSAWTSSDGLAWTKASSLPIEPGSISVGAAGLYADSGGSTPDVWRSTDGKTWAHVTVPAGHGAVRSFAIPGGGFVGECAADMTLEIVRSGDGLTWQPDQGNLPGTPYGMVVSGDRMLASVGPSQLPTTVSTATFAVSQSTDWGLTWQPLLDPSGQATHGIVGQIGDLVTISSIDGAAMSPTLAWVIARS